MQNNHLKLTRWGIQSYLAGVDAIFLGFVSRKLDKSIKEHNLYGFHKVEPKLLLNHVNFNYHVGWGMIKHLYENLQSAQDGNYILMKTASGQKQLIKLLMVKENKDKEEEN